MIYRQPESELPTFQNFQMNLVTTKDFIAVIEFFVEEKMSVVLKEIFTYCKYVSVNRVFFF